jgi:hypothetical protein
MLGSKRLTTILFVTLVLMIISSTLAFNKQAQPGQSSNAPSQRRINVDELRKKDAELRSHFPVVDYDAPENTTDPEILARRKERNKHFDNRNLVSRDPTPRVTETALTLEGYYVPALPVTQSGLIISGEVLDSQAHLSNDKHGIYTELTVRVDEVINNSTSAQIAQGKTITAEREGGIVQYSNGNQRLYHLAGEGMPVAGRKYVLFLKAIEQSHDYEILTGYELSPTGVVPVDLSSQFKPYEGYGVDAFLDAIRAAITGPRQTAPNN